MGFITSLVLVVLAIGLLAVYLKMRQRDQIDVILKKRQPGSKLVSRADYMEGMQKIPVAVALSGDTFYYENTDLEASFELARIEEVEYTDELATGKAVPPTCRVLRLRSHGAAFEFVMERAEATKWAAALPARRMGEPAAQAV